MDAFLIGHVHKALEVQEVQWFNTAVVVLNAQGGFTPLRSLLDFRMWHCRDGQCPLEAPVHSKDFCFPLEQLVLFPEFLSGAADGRRKTLPSFFLLSAAKEKGLPVVFREYLSI